MVAFDERGAININFKMFESSNHSLLFPLFSRLTKLHWIKKEMLNSNQNIKYSYDYVTKDGVAELLLEHRQTLMLFGRCCLLYQRYKRYFIPYPDSWTIIIFFSFFSIFRKSLFHSNRINNRVRSNRFKNENNKYFPRIVNSI